MANRKLRRGRHRRRAVFKVGLGRQKADRLARIFIRRRNAIGAAMSSPSPSSPQKECSSDSFSTDELSSCETLDDVFDRELGSEIVDLPKCISFEAEDGDKTSSDPFKIIGTSVEDYFTPLEQDKIFGMSLEGYFDPLKQEKIIDMSVEAYFDPLEHDKLADISVDSYLKTLEQGEVVDSPVDSHWLPLVQDKEPLFNLSQEITSHHLQEKIMELHENYNSFRRVRGDGNCFLRAFKFAYLEHLLLMNDMEEANRILAKIEDFKCSILLENFTSSKILMDDYDAFRDIVKMISSSLENQLSHAVLLEWSKAKDGYSDPAIRFLRMVISSEIRRRPNHYEQSIQGLSCDTTMTVEKFCEVEVEPMGKDVDNVQITAFVDAFGVPIRIEYVDDSKHKLNHYDFGIEASKLEEPYITLLYRPGHYDILYRKDYHMLVPEAVKVGLKDSETSEKEPTIVADDPLTSQMDPTETDEDALHHPLITYIRRKRKDCKEE